MTESVLIVGVGSGLSASLARLCSKKNMIVNLAARNIDKLKALKEETNANTYQCDSTNKENVSTTRLDVVENTKQINEQKEKQLKLASEIKTNKDIRVPNIGWRKILHSNSSILLKGLEVDPIFYFVHSYACKTLDDQVVTGGLNYGNNFDVIIGSENVFGTQFHPEKSQTAGLRILKNFSLLS